MSSSDIVKDNTVVDTRESHALSSDDASEIDFNSTKPYIDIVVKLDDSEIKRRSSWWYKIGFFLYDSLDKHEHERSFLFKLDFFLLSSACLGYFIKTLNQNNIGTAYVNGMKEHYDMKGNDYNLMVTLWTNLISRLENSIGSWYSKKELTKRAAFFGFRYSCWLASVSTWPHKHFNLSNGCLLLMLLSHFPVALYTLFVDPNTPSTTNAWYFSRRDKLVALERRRRDGSQLNIREPYTLAKIKSFFNTWHIWVFPPLFLFYNNSGQPTTSQAFPLWIKTTLKLDSYYYNNYPIIISGGGISKLTATIPLSNLVLLPFGLALVSNGTSNYSLAGLFHHDDFKLTFGNYPLYGYTLHTILIGLSTIACLASAGIVFVTIALVLTIRDNKREERLRLNFQNLN
ncbi:Pantothenate transporter liz1 [Cyberlindnera fabianii]|uniref:Pantothenate transporter liz1 n=1 Tax=Cyberlindnera fabianii TaxID=36022 RepID=A0A1V2L1H1_CYBFA|nr:Pantothenate transporter liz1 [Cyberlindnera fabianii]